MSSTISCGVYFLVSDQILPLHLSLPPSAQAQSRSSVENLGKIARFEDNIETIDFYVQKLVYAQRQILKFSISQDSKDLSFDSSYGKFLQNLIERQLKEILSIPISTKEANSLNIDNLIRGNLVQQRSGIQTSVNRYWRLDERFDQIERSAYDIERWQRSLKALNNANSDMSRLLAKIPSSATGEPFTYSITQLRYDLMLLPMVINRAVRLAQGKLNRIRQNLELRRKRMEIDGKKLSALLLEESRALTKGLEDLEKSSSLKALNNRSKVIVKKRREVSSELSTLKATKTKLENDLLAAKERLQDLQRRRKDLKQTLGRYKYIDQNVIRWDNPNRKQYDCPSDTANPENCRHEYEGEDSKYKGRLLKHIFWQDKSDIHRKIERQNDRIQRNLSKIRKIRSMISRESQNLVELKKQLERARKEMVSIEQESLRVVEEIERFIPDNHQKIEAAVLLDKNAADQFRVALVRSGY